MSRSKKIFFLFAIVFLMILLYISYDFSRRTTFPGSKPSSRGQHDRERVATDSTADTPGDSL